MSDLTCPFVSAVSISRLNMAYAGSANRSMALVSTAIYLSSSMRASSCSPSAIDLYPYYLM